MNAKRPTAAEIERLVAFLPQLSEDGFVPVRGWGGGEKTEDGGVVMLWPVYAPVVKAFFEAAGQDCWMDFDYVPDRAGEMLERLAELRAQER